MPPASTKKTDAPTDATGTNPTTTDAAAPDAPFVPHPATPEDLGFAAPPSPEPVVADVAPKSIEEEIASLEPPVELLVIHSPHNRTEARLLARPGASAKWFSSNTAFQQWLNHVVPAGLEEAKEHLPRLGLMEGPLPPLPKEPKA